MITCTKGFRNVDYETVKYQVREVWFCASSFIVTYFSITASNLVCAPKIYGFLFDTRYSSLGANTTTFSTQIRSYKNPFQYLTIFAIEPYYRKHSTCTQNIGLTQVLGNHLFGICKRGFSRVQVNNGFSCNFLFHITIYFRSLFHSVSNRKLPNTNLLNICIHQ